MSKSTVLVVSAAKYLLKEKRLLLTAVGVFFIFTLFTAPLFSMIAFTRGGERLIRQASAQEEDAITRPPEEPFFPPSTGPTIPPSEPTEPSTPFSQQQDQEEEPEVQEAVPEEGETTAPPTEEPQPLTASISIDSTNGDTAPATFLFEADAQGGTSPYTYIWNFGDDSPQGSGISIHHTFEQAGTYDVTLAVTDSTAPTPQDISVTRQVNVRPATTEQPPTNETTPTPVNQTTPTNATELPPGTVTQTPTPVNKTLLFDNLFNDYCIAGTGGTEDPGAPTPTFPEPLRPCIPCDPGLPTGDVCVYRDPFGLLAMEPQCGNVLTNQSMTLTPLLSYQLATNAETIHQAGVLFLNRLLNETQGDLMLVAKSATKQLEDLRAITAEEAQQLNAIYSIVADNQTALSEKIEQVGSIYNTMSNNPSSCPAAIGIAGIAFNSLNIVSDSLNIAENGEQITTIETVPPTMLSADQKGILDKAVITASKDIAAGAGLGALAGKFGAWFGATAGATAGGIGAAPGAVVGATVFGIAGAVFGAIAGSTSL